MENFAIATFCYGDRYHKQVNRMISEIDLCDFKPTVVVVTDDTSKILDKSFVKKYDITDFNPDYKIFSESYYTFDFSVKRYSLLAALNLGFNKIILTDADAIPNKSLFNEDYIIKGFVENSIQGQVTYNFSQQILTNSQLGKRFLFYENYYGVNYDKNELNFMPEDCIQFLDIEIPKFYNFLRVWDQLIKIKNSNNLSNTPAGNIDEMCFAALNCGISVGNNSDKTMNSMINIHDKWYDTHLIVPTESIKARKKTIVSSVYQLNYIDERGGGVYKSFHLLTQTLRNIIFDDFNYVIYTDKKTYEKHNLSEIFNYDNVTIKFKELNSDFYVDFLNPIRERRIMEGEIWDRIHCVKNYIEVIYNKFSIILDESKNSIGEVVWIDSGLFGTSCSNGWRDHMNELGHTKLFLDKIFEKIKTFDFISLKGNHILINYEVKDKINNFFNTDLNILPGCLFGGKSELIVEYFENYKNVIEQVVEILNDYLSEQEILFLILDNKICKFFEFDDWDDLQRGILKIMDLYEESTYDKSSPNFKEITEEVIKDVSNMSMTELADYCGIDKGSLYENHRYTEIYEPLLDKHKSTKPIIIEIGINDPRFPGKCLKFWDLYFSQMDYYGFDIVDCSGLKFNRDKITTFIGDQNNPEDLLSLINQYDLSGRIDIIIDDGSHLSQHIITSFKTLFPHLKKGGFYFVQSLHAGWAEREKTVPELKNIVSNFEDSEYFDYNNKLFYVKK
jgi:hypothetical protein